MDYFLMFYAPIIVIIASVAVAFWIAHKDDLVEKEGWENNHNPNNLNRK